MATSLLDESPFVRLAALLGDEAPGMEPINLSVGEPHHPLPAVIAPAFVRDVSGLGKYPAIAGLPEFRSTVADWARRRFGLAALDADREVCILAGSREGLLMAALTARQEFAKPAPVALLPNPFYQAYGASAIAAGLEPVLLPADAGNGYLPSIEAVEPAILERTVVAYFTSPSNPAGTVASPQRMKAVAECARRHDFLLASDECYSEIWFDAPPAGALSATAEHGFSNVIALNSLSKRSSAPGLRCGFAAGDRRFMKSFVRLRNLCGPQVALPVQNAAIAAYGDETHVEENRALYAAKFALADELVGFWPGYRRPQGGFFLWLDVAAAEDDERFALRAWREKGLRMVPGSYFGRPGLDGVNPGAGHVRIALVDDIDLTRDALTRLASLLKGNG
ncbi:MAG: aminotransferase class I/II-fold pyridoxal phosphate-dependent enzyme [Flavobacteriaceae bacterium]